MIVIATDVVENYLVGHAGQKGIKAARSQYEAWLAIVSRAHWRNPEDVKASYPNTSILKAGRVVFNIKGNDYRLVAAVQYRAGVLRSDSSAATDSTIGLTRRPFDGCDSHRDR